MRVWAIFLIKNLSAFLIGQTHSERDIRRSRFLIKRLAHHQDYIPKLVLEVLYFTLTSGWAIRMFWLWAMCMPAVFYTSSKGRITVAFWQNKVDKPPKCNSNYWSCKVNDNKPVRLMIIDCLEVIFSSINVCLIFSVYVIWVLTKPNLVINEIFKQIILLQLPSLLETNFAKHKTFESQLI